MRQKLDLAMTSALTFTAVAFILEAMEVRLKPEKEAELQSIALRTGRQAAKVVEEAVDRSLEYDARFLAAIEKGRESARAGNLIEHELVVERIEQMLRS